MRYPGGKNGAGVWQKIISLMPRHRMYVEAFGGSGAIIRRKAPAERNVYIDLDPATLKAARAAAGSSIARNVEWICGDAGDLVPSLVAPVAAGALVYIDPPYLRSVRTRRVYRCEMMTPDEHAALLTWAKKLWPSMVMISGYYSPLYATMLQGWHTEHFQAMTRGGVREEWLWMNFVPGNASLHDPRFVGADYRERERIKRKRLRWSSRLAAMPPAERQLIREALNAVDGGEVLSTRSTIARKAGAQ